MSPATVATSSRYDSLQIWHQRKSFFAEGLFWAFYHSGSSAYYEHSHDGITWAEGATSIGACTRGFVFSIWFDGTYVHYARSNNYDLFYRRGVPDADGTITWSAGEQLIYNGVSGDNYSVPVIAVGTNGYAWIGVNFNKPGTDDFPAVLKNANNDGTWVLDFVYELSAIDNPQWRAAPIPLTGGKVYVVYCYGIGGTSPFGRLYDAGWGAEESDLTDYNIYRSDYFAVAALGDNVHFIYLRDITYQFRHNERVWGVGWDVSDVLVQDTMSTADAPVLSVDPSESDLYCFWALKDGHVYYRQYTGGVWQGRVDWIDESVDEIQYDNLISGYYKDYGRYIGLLYTTKLASPYNIRFAFLDLRTSWSGKISGVTDPAEIMGVAKADIAEVMGVA